MRLHIKRRTIFFKCAADLRMMKVKWIFARSQCEGTLASHCISGTLLWRDRLEECNREEGGQGNTPRTHPALNGTNGGEVKTEQSRDEKKSPSWCCGLFRN